MTTSKRSNADGSYDVTVTLPDGSKVVVTQPPLFNAGPPVPRPRRPRAPRKETAKAKAKNVGPPVPPGFCRKCGLKGCTKHGDVVA